MTTTHGPAVEPATDATFEELAAPLRRQLLAHRSRMLGSPTKVRA